MKLANALLLSLILVTGLPVWAEKAGAGGGGTQKTETKGGGGGGTGGSPPQKKLQNAPKKALSTVVPSRPRPANVVIIGGYS